MSMSDNSNLRPPNPSNGQNVESSGAIRHECVMMQKIGALHLDADFADIFLLVEGSRLPAHKLILSAA